MNEEQKVELKLIHMEEVVSKEVRQSTVYNRYATLIFTNPVFLGFSRYQNVKFGSQRDNSNEYHKRANFPENIEFSGISLYFDNSIRHHKTHKIFTLTNK